MADLGIVKGGGGGGQDGVGSGRPPLGKLLKFVLFQGLFVAHFMS